MTRVGSARPIYVESRIRTSLDRIWDATQDPDQHRRWDVRFGEIAYEPHEAGEPRRFTYATTVAPGVTITGTGETLGDRDRPDGSRWSGLKFWAGDRRSIIDAGAGHWQYVPTTDGIRFLTRYDYRARWGRVGAVLDRIAFRPLFGWATAWSFDRLRRWLEDGVPPEQSRDQAVAHAAAIAGLAGVWLYQGLVPKLWRVDDGETRIWQGLGARPRASRSLVRMIGVAEVGLAAAAVTGRRRRTPFLVMAATMPVLAAGAALADHGSATRAFNPVSLNWAIATLAVIAATTVDGLPSAARPRRTPPQQPDDEVTER